MPTTHEIHSSFSDYFEVQGVFLDISKAFDKVWHDGLIYSFQEKPPHGSLYIYKLACGSFSWKLLET